MVSSSTCFPPDSVLSPALVARMTVMDHANQVSISQFVRTSRYHRVADHSSSRRCIRRPEHNHGVVPKVIHRTRKLREPIWDQPQERCCTLRSEHSKTDTTCFERPSQGWVTEDGELRSDFTCRRSNRVVRGMVVVPKRQRNIRVCVDLKALNESVQHETFPLTRVDEVLAQLSGATTFSKLDANSGFWQIPLADQSRSLTTFITPYGRFQFNKLPFGITCAPELFHRRMSQILSRLERVLCLIYRWCLGVRQISRGAWQEAMSSAEMLGGSQRNTHAMQTNVRSNAL